MQVNLDTQNYNYSTNFGKLKKVYGGKVLNRLIGDDGLEIEKQITQSLKANKSFNTLCEKYNVFVGILPHFRPTPNSLYLEKGLSIEVFAKEINKGVFGFLKKKQMMPVSKYMAVGTEAKTWDLAEYIMKNHIKPEEGLSTDIDKFLNK